ncbi:MAG: hypothetical protein H7252_03980 [Cytophaga sp.]|nr:hypothetical protein [Undibacterium sp.]
MTSLRSFWKHHKSGTVTIGGALIVIAVATAIFALRYKPAFTIANFYAEDGRVFTDNVLHKGVLQALTSGFNGYLVVGQYLLLEVVVLIYHLFGLQFYQLPLVIAAVSCLFLGLTVSLPYLLFRKQLGTPLSVATVLITAFVPMPTFDYAVIGTIGNLKFAFLYWAVLLIVYRNMHWRELRKVAAVDLLLLICVFTNAPVVLVLPFILVPYFHPVVNAVRNKKLSLLIKPTYTSAVAVIIIAFIYLGSVYLLGIPKLPGYLDTPFMVGATLKIAYRVTLYGFMAPVTSSMRDLLTLALLAVIALRGVWRKESRFVTVLGLWAIFVATAGFVVNRPGISSYYLSYRSGPDQFFYAQTLVFIFLVMWLLHNAAAHWHQKQIAILAAIVALFLWWSVPYSGSFGKNKIIYQDLGSAKADVAKACSVPGKNVTMQIYPAAAWQWSLERDIACK